MAITIRLEPKQFLPGYNEVDFSLTSTKSGEDNFLYIIDIKTGKDTSSLVNTSRLEISNRPNGVGLTDLHKHIEQFVTYDKTHDELEIFTESPNSYIYYDVSLKESYLLSMSYSISGTAGFVTSEDNYFSVGDEVLFSDSSSALYDGVQIVNSIVSDTQFTTEDNWQGISSTGTVYLASQINTDIPSSATFSDYKLAFNGVLSNEDFIDYLDDDFTYQIGTSSSLLLTNIIPNQFHDTFLDDRIYLNAYNNTGTASTDFPNALRIVSDNGIYQVTNTVKNGDTSRLHRIGVGPWNLNNTTSSVSIISGSLPIVGSNTKSYSIVLKNVNGDDVSQTYKFKLKENCSRYENYKLFFLDELGSFISLNFNMLSKEDKRIKRTSYIKDNRIYDTNTHTVDRSLSNRGKTNLDTEVTSIITINSDWVSERTNDLIIKMIESPEVYLLDGDKLKAINIIDTSVKVQKKINDQLINHTIKFEYSYKNKKQRG